MGGVRALFGEVFVCYIEATGWLYRVYEASDKLPEVEIAVVVVD